MESAKKALEIQAQVRHNAEDFKNSLNDLYSWEKEMKEKEQELLRGPIEQETEHLKTLPVRSHMMEQQAENKSQQKRQQQEKQAQQNTHNNAATATAARKTDNEAEHVNQFPSPTEKSDPIEEKRQQANLIKDRGNAHVKRGEYAQAIEEYSTAIEMYPEDPIYYNNRALCYLKLERYDACIEDCERAIQVDSLAVKAYYRRMQANECLGNNMDALKDCTTVLMIEPKNTEAMKSLERINDRLRKHTKSPHGPNFSPLRNELIDILPIEKPAYKRSNKLLRRVLIADVVGPKDTKNYENSNLQISDEDIDKLFNSNCGPFVEVKKPSKTTVQETATGSKNVNSTVPQQAATKQISPTSNAAVDNNKQSTRQATDKSLTITSTKQPQVDSNKKAIADNKMLEIANNTAILVNANRPLLPAPTSTAQFYSNWKELTPTQKYQYLQSIEIPNLCKILGAGFDSDTLNDILHTLRDHYVTNKETTTAATLLEVSKNNQVTILSLLLSTDERKALTEILNFIKEHKSNASVASLIAKNFNLY